MSILSVVLVSNGFCEQASPVDKTIMREGFVLELIPGTVENTDGLWTFTLEQEVTDWVKTLQPGTRIEILSSSTLERMASLVDPGKNKIRVRIQGTILKYHSQNYLFPTAFIPLAEVKEVQPEPQPQQEPAQADQVEVVTADTPKPDDSVLSDDVKDLLGGGWAPSVEKMRPKPQPKKDTPKSTGTVETTDSVYSTSIDYNLVGRPGFVVINGNLKSFKIDCLGRKIDNSTYVLLPCGALETFEETKYDMPGRRRYMVSGIVTSYKGQNYLLMQRLVRMYNNDNFAR